MAEKTQLSGACFCGANTYTLTLEPLPEGGVPNATGPPYVYYDSCSDCRRIQAAPIVGWVRIPASWYSSSATKPDAYRLLRSSETVERRFCGECGTHLTFAHPDKTEPDGVKYMDVTLGSLTEESLARLEQLGLVPDEHYYWGSGLSWFKKQLAGSLLGRFKKYVRGSEKEGAVIDAGKDE